VIVNRYHVWWCLCCRETRSGTCGGLLLCYHHLLTGRSLKIM